MRITRFISTVLSVVFSGTVAVSAPVLTNGGFEQNPPGGYGNHIGWDISPWVLGGGSSSNVVSVDGPGGQTSYENASLGPGFDATGGAGHYLDIAGGSNDFYQEFTPLCSGEVQFGAYFSTRDNSDGTAVVTIKDATGSTDISAPATVNLPGGTSGTDPWTLASFTTILTANTTYRFHVQMDNNMNMDNAFVNFGPSCTEHEDFPHDQIPDPDPLTDVEVQKICDPIEYADNGDFVLACHLNVQATEPFPSTISINDSFTLNTAAVSAISSTENWACTDSVSGSSLDVACTLPVSDIPASGVSVIDVTMTFPADTPPEGLYNCADGTFEIAGTEPHAIEESCVRIELPEPPEPVQCLAFEPELSCNTQTGQIEVILSNTLSGSFGPDDVEISSSTSGVVLNAPDPSNPLLVALSGVVPGQTLSLLIDAVETGGGSAPGLDKCCLGEVEITVPQDFVCEKDPLLEIEKTCYQGSDAVNQPWCEITVHYEGPPPTDADPITLGEEVTTGNSGFNQLPASGDNWQCAADDPFNMGCSISDSDAPGTDWSNWTSTLSIPIATGEVPGQYPLPANFENCASVSIGGLSAQDCWSNDTPQLEIVKTGPEVCYLGEPCEFTYTITNTSPDQDFNGSINLSDELEFTSGNGSFTPTDGGIVSMDPPLCTAAELNSGTCNTNLSLGASQSQSYTVSYVPPPYALADGEYSLENCVELISDGGSFSQDCATVSFQPQRLTLEKTGPSQCDIGETCDFTITISAGDQPYSGNVLLTDGTNVPAFDITAISPPTAGCGANLPANPLMCVVPVNLPANGSISYTISITPQSPQNQVVAESGENCAYVRSLPADSTIVPGDYSFNQYATPPNFPPQFADLMQGGMIGESCVWFDVPQETGQTGAGGQIDLAISKAWAEGPEFFAALEPGDNAQIPPHGYVIDVSQITGSLQTGDVITVTDPASGQSGITFFGAPYAPAPWFCTMNGGDMTCSYTVPADGPVNPPAILWPAVNDPAVDSTNCANVAVYSGTSPDPVPETDTQNNSACVTVPGDQAPEPVQAEVSVEKQCDPITTNGGKLEMNCTITVQALNDFTGLLRIIDVMHQVAGSTGTVTGITPPNSDWSCNTGNNACTIDSADFGAGDTAVFTVVVTGPDTGKTTTWRNCGDINWVTNGGNTAAFLTNNCDSQTYEQGQRAQLPTGDGIPHLVLRKTSTGPCSVNRAAQSYTCGFRLEVANEGNAAFAGPLVLSEIFGKPAPRRMTGSGDGWTCNPASADGSTCQTDLVTLGVGETGSLDVTLTLSGLRHGGQFENCAALGVADNLRDQAMVLQRIMQMRGIDGGPVDGKPGRKTRAGLRLLQQQLGLEPTGKIDPALFASLGLSAATEQAKKCITVDLPPMPKPMLQCNRDTTVARGGECVCRYARMIRKGNNACGCVRGTRFVAGKGCIPTSSGKPDTAAPKPAACPKGTQYVRGKGCVKPRPACPNGRPRNPLLGCTNITIGIGGSGTKHKDGP